MKNCIWAFERFYFPNKFNQITKSGNYIITVLNDEGEIVFSRKIVIYEEEVNVGLLVRRSRDFEGLDTKQNIEQQVLLKKKFEGCWNGAKVIDGVTGSRR